MIRSVYNVEHTFFLEIVIIKCEFSDLVKFYDKFLFKKKNRTVETAYRVCMWHNVCNEQLKTNEPVQNEKKSSKNVEKNHEEIVCVQNVCYVCSLQRKSGFFSYTFVH